MKSSSGTSKTAVMAAIIGGKIETVLGWIFAVAGGFCTIIGLAIKYDGTDGKAIGLAILFVVDLIGVLWIIHGRATKNRVRRFRQYVSIINEHQTSVDQIANAVNKPVAYVQRDIEGMIKSKYFNNAYIDDITHRVVFGQKASISLNDVLNEVSSFTMNAAPPITINIDTPVTMNTAPAVAADAAPSTSAPDKTVNHSAAAQEIQVVTCKCCGASNKIAKGTVGECEYCGSPIQ